MGGCICMRMRGLTSTIICAHAHLWACVHSPCVHVCMCAFSMCVHVGMCGHVWACVGMCGHVWAYVCMCGHVSSSYPRLASTCPRPLSRWSTGAHDADEGSPRSRRQLRRSHVPMYACMHVLQKYQACMYQACMYLHATSLYRTQCRHVSTRALSACTCAYACTV